MGQVIQFATHPVTQRRAAAQAFDPYGFAAFWLSLLAGMAVVALVERREGL